MSKPTARRSVFAELVSSFLNDHCPNTLNLSDKTIRCYRQAFLQLYRFLNSKRDLEPYLVEFDDLDIDTIEEFLNWIENDRGCSVRTRNNRLSALHSLARYAQYRAPEYIASIQQILAVRPKKAPARAMEYLSVEEVEALLEAAGRKSLRHHAMLRLLYDSGARVQELADLNVCDVMLESRKHKGFSVVTLRGKGRKVRVVPLMPQTTEVLKAYLKRFHKGTEPDDPLFYNNSFEHLNRDGVAYVLNKYVEEVRLASPQMIKTHVTPHTLRHSKATHLYQAGVPLKEVSLFLGHSSVVTTEIYAKASPQTAMEAIGTVNRTLMREVFFSAEAKEDLLTWFDSEIMGKK